MSDAPVCDTAPTRALPTGFRAARTRSFDRATLEYAISAPVAGAPPAMLIHGWGCHRGFFAHQLERLARSRQVVALDLAGHGASGAGRRNYAIEEFARDVAAVAAAAELERFIAVGHSMGGAVAVETARALGPRVPAVVAIDSLTYAAVYPQVPAERVETAVASFRADFAAAVRATMEPVFVAETPEPLRRAILAEISATPREPGIRAIGGLLAWDGARAVETCPAPIRCLNAQALFAESVGTPYLDHLEIELLGGVGHFLLLETPEEVGASLAALLARVA